MFQCVCGDWVTFALSKGIRPYSLTVVAAILIVWNYSHPHLLAVGASAWFSSCAQQLIVVNLKLRTLFAEVWSRLTCLYAIRDVTDSSRWMSWSFHWYFLCLNYMFNLLWYVLGKIWALYYSSYCKVHPESDEHMYLIVHWELVELWSGWALVYT